VLWQRKLSPEEAGRNGGWRRIKGLFREGALEFEKELRGIILRRGRKLRRENEMRAEDSLGRGKVGGVMRRRI
jgi:hypothetical protein